MGLDDKFEHLSEEILNIKRQLREGAKISDDTRKAIIHDVFQMEREHRNKRLLAVSAVFTLVVSAISFIGYSSLKQSVTEEITKSKIKESVILELTQQRNEFSDEINKLKVTIDEFRSLESKIVSKYGEIEKGLAVREEKNHRLLKLFLKKEIDQFNVVGLLDPDFKVISSSLEEFNFIRAFGIDEIYVIILLSVYVDDFSPSKITKLSLQTAVKQLQNQFGLTVDGLLGPCTSLIFSSLMYADYPLQISEGLENSVFKERSWLAASFQACSREDKVNLSRYLDYPDLPLHKELNNFLQAANIDRSTITSNLNTYKVDSNGYRALESLGINTNIQ